MAMRRRRFRRSFAGRKGGRKFFWFRFTPFGVTLREAASATHSDIFLDNSDWVSPVAGINETQRGGPRLERLIVEFGLAIDGDDSFWVPAGDGNIDIIPEFMIWKQSDQFGSVVTGSTSFDLSRDDQRIIMDTVPELGPYNSKDLAPGGRSIRSVRGRYETKSKVRLSDASLGIAWRGFFDTGSANLNGYTDWVRPTLLISTP